MAPIRKFSLASRLTAITNERKETDLKFYKVMAIPRYYVIVKHGH
jgi:hypothetical protein